MAKLFKFISLSLISISLQSCMVIDWFNTEFLGQEPDRFSPSYAQESFNGSVRRPANGRSVAGAQYGMGDGVIGGRRQMNQPMQPNMFGNMQGQMAPQMPPMQQMPQMMAQNNPAMGMGLGSFGSPNSLQQMPRQKQGQQPSPPVYNVANQQSGQMAILPNPYSGSAPEMMQMAKSQGFSPYNAGYPGQANPWAMMPPPSNQISNINYTPGGYFPNAQMQGYDNSSPYATAPMAMPQQPQMPAQFGQPSSVTNYGPETSPAFAPQTNDNSPQMSPSSQQYQTMPAGTGVPVGPSYLEQQGYNENQSLGNITATDVAINQATPQNPQEFANLSPAAGPNEQQLQQMILSPAAEGLPQDSEYYIPQEGDENISYLEPLDSPLGTGDENFDDDIGVIQESSAQELYNQQMQQAQQMPQQQYRPAVLPKPEADEMYRKYQDSINKNIDSSYDSNRPIVPDLALPPMQDVVSQSKPASMIKQYPKSLSF